ncbi:MAG: DUF488 domain-containing protein [Pseudomonadales bacterium]|nr:DUF488 domain-containing protein [Pseudomonadales bacterium]
MRILTIGFTKKTAKRFFDLLQSASVKRVVDVRLNNVSQLSGFAKRDDLAYFLEGLCSIDYVHKPTLAPTQEILTAYRKKQISWEEYEEQFLKLMSRRRVEDQIDPKLLDDACLLCSEDKPHQCHRRLVAEYFKERWDGVEIEHLT